MKKVIALSLMILMMMALSVNAFAADGGFLSSPSKKPAPEVEDYDPENEDCESQITIDPYSDRGELSDELKKLYEEAYSDIASGDDIIELNVDLAAVVNANGVTAAVSDLFYIHATDCDCAEHHSYTLTLSADTLSNFVGLMYKNGAGEWVLVKDAKVSENGESLTFTLNEFGPYAIVVDASNNGPQTFDNIKMDIYIAVMAASAVGIVVLWVINRRRLLGR